MPRGARLWPDVGMPTSKTMPLKESEAIILRTYPLGEADRIVSFLSRAAGRLRGVARGARRPRSRFGAALEPLSHVRLWYYERSTRDLVRLSQCELIQSSFQAQRDYGQSLALSHVAELAETLLPERESSDTVFRLLLMVLEAIRQGRTWLAITYLELWMVRLAGLLPDFASCGRCRRELTGRAYGSALGSNLLCATCRQPGMRMIAPESVAQAQLMLAHSLTHLETEGWERDRAADLRRYLLDVIEHHAERQLATRPLLQSLEADKT